jgi:cysteinyl-tRNA synthetase
MKIYIYNTLTRKKEEFIPLKEEVGFYSCGPTVYWHPHIGNMRAYVFNDILKRVLLFNNYKVKHIMNYTDVGHLTSDADEGEDKIEKAARKENKTAQEIANYYIDVFDKDVDKLNILRASATCKATEYIKEQIEIIKELEKKGYTYITKDGVYFDTSKDKEYGSLGNINIEGLEEGKRIDIGEKKNKTDFALWKFSEEPGKRQQEWESPWGIGFPGWHTECVVMATEFLGEQFDLHTGGEDHIQVHHTNEIAQAECTYGKKPWVKYWLHVSYLLYKGEKVSKSKGGLYTLDELNEMGYDPLVVRYFFLTAHYRKQQNFSLEALDGVKQALSKLRDIVINLKESKEEKEISKNKEKYLDDFNQAVNDDLNMPQALAILWEMVKDKEINDKDKLELIYRFDEVLGLDLKNYEKKKEVFSEEELKIIDERKIARENKDWKRSDELRDELLKKGIISEDTKEGTEYKRV